MVRPTHHRRGDPNANGIAAQNLVRLAVLTGDDIWRERADILFDGMLPAAGREHAYACEP